MPARVFTLGIKLPGDVGEYVSFKSDMSLFDADIVIFCPTFDRYVVHRTYQGKGVISDNDSPQIRRDCDHWRGELNAAVDAGKVVFVYLTKPDEVFYHTGEQTYSGTGRNRITTNEVRPISSYDSIPVSLEGLIPRGGSAISVLGELGPLAAYWSQFAPLSEYEAYFGAKGLEPLLGTKRREKVVGAVVRKKGGGAFVLLPPVNWDKDALTYSRGKSVFGRKEGLALGNRLIGSLIAASDALRREGKRTPLPEWAIAIDYALPIEERLRREAAEADLQISALAERNRNLQKQADEAAQLRDLLFETGKPLENAVLKALRLFGFTAEPYRDAESEFDVIFSSPEGRFLGEAEGKDSKAVNIDKMSQLERNLQEDFAREGITEFAKGVLFGNAFRLESPPARAQFFTDKCVTSAKRLKVALVRTPDLFEPARYLSSNTNAGYTELCRRAIFAADGEVVLFPKPPLSG